MGDDEEDLKKELVKHLSSEIEKQSEYLLTLRSRMAFTVLIGPFIIVGSVLIAIKDRPLHIQIHLSLLVLFAMGFALASYMALAYYGARLDRNATEQSDRWREAMVRILHGEEISAKELKPSNYHPLPVYVFGFGIVIIAFASIMVLVVQLLNSGNAVPR